LADRAEQVVAGASASTRMFLELMKHTEVVTPATEVLPVAYPWVRYLPKADVQVFVSSWWTPWSGPSHWVTPRRWRIWWRRGDTLPRSMPIPSWLEFWSRTAGTSARS